jgi:hypothetical protein
MKQWIRRNSDKFAVVGAAIVMAGLSFGTGNTCPVAEPPKGGKDANIEKAGETVMLTATKHEGKVHHADEDNFAELVLGSDVPVLFAYDSNARQFLPLAEQARSDGCT